MDKNEFDTLAKDIHYAPLMAYACHLGDQTPRTLAYGYTCERETFHVYLAEDGIHKVVYAFDGQLLSHKHESEGLLLTECVPDKRLYPEACDFYFCAYLKLRGVSLPFTTWNDKREPQQFHGKRREDLYARKAA